MRILVRFVLALLLATSASAQDRDFVLQFIPPEDSSVEAYYAYLTDRDNGLEESRDLGLVLPDADGIARASVGLDSTRSYMIEMTAANLAGESERSNAITVDPEAPVCQTWSCDDGNPCTADSCDGSGCLNVAVAEGTACDDGYVDTVDDQCVQGVCEGMLVACRGDLDCDDGDVCNGLETCDGGSVCLQGDPLDCGPQTACRIPSCDPVQGCLVELQPDGTACDDGLAETSGDVCQAGVCQGTPSVPASPLTLEALDPDSVSPGAVTITLYGTGFEPGATLGFSGKGKPPSVLALRLLDDRTLEADLLINNKGPKHSHRLDVSVTLPDGTATTLPEALRIVP